MCNTMKLKGKIRENGMTVKEFARAIHIDIATLYRRFEKGDTFTVGEVSKAVEVLKLTEEEALAIFLPSMSQK
ncbi:helix-turn-helix domain-containing protein [Butyrivibrio proteoclasticus]|uniref:helix-turn-helix domain-containing protein n=1 Tax=Butyrivibrio proteoclasticus TaxID=43305 RepID=UPI00047CAD76|nr:helix-turn-helix transcriptional regulator [Butyrivibrio proteoclasticus]